MTEPRRRSGGTPQVSQADRGWQREAARELAAILDAHPDLPAITWTISRTGGITGGVDSLALAPEVRAKKAANARWSRYRAREDQSVAARAAIFARLERKVDPEGKLPSDERAVLVREEARCLSGKLNAAAAPSGSLRASASTVS